MFTNGKKSQNIHQQVDSTKRVGFPFQNIKTKNCLRFKFSSRQIFKILLNNAQTHIILISRIIHEIMMYHQRMHFII